MFHQKRFYVLSIDFFPVFTYKFNMPFVRHRGTKSHMAMTQRQSSFPVEKNYLFSLKGFWSKPTHSSSLVGYYNAIYY